MHKVAEPVAAGLPVPLLHIADVTGQAIAAQGLKRVTLLGTRYTMEQTFYTDHLARMGIECTVPPSARRDEVHRIIFDELCLGRVLPASARGALQAMVAEAAAQQGSQGVILGCTELSMILAAGDLGQPLFDTTALHAQAAADFALSASPAPALAD